MACGMHCSQWHGHGMWCMAFSLACGVMCYLVCKWHVMRCMALGMACGVTSGIACSLWHLAWHVVYGKWRGLWSVAFGVPFHTVCGVWCFVWHVECGMWFIVFRVCHMVWHGI